MTQCVTKFLFLGLGIRGSDYFEGTSMQLNWDRIKSRSRGRFGLWLTLVVVFGLGTHSAGRGAAGDVAAVVAGNNRFAFDMYHRLRTSETVAENNGNLIFSPYSISTAVGMVHAGARGQTAQEIADVFHFGLPQERLHPAYGSLIRDLNGSHRTGYQLSVANRLWGQQGFPMHQPFLDTTRDHYGAELGRLDFVRDAENSRQTINRWVEEQTNDRIKDLIPSGGINNQTRLVFTNAIYFNGDWKHAFNKNATQDRPFAVNATEQIRAPTMFQNGRFRYADGGDFQMLELPYKGDQLSMLIVLPKAGGRADEPAWGGGSDDAGDRFYWTNCSAGPSPDEVNAGGDAHRRRHACAIHCNSAKRVRARARSASMRLRRWKRG